MKRILELSLKAMRKVISILRSQNVAPIKCIADPDRASERISELLSSPNPCMIARFGSTEMNTVLNYLSVKNGRDVIGYLSGATYQWWWNKKGISQMKTNSGFFPNTVEYLEKFCEQMMIDAKDVDYLGSWLSGEEKVCPTLGPLDKTHLRFLEPFWSSSPWTKALEGHNVLVVHPFAELIETQYKNNRNYIFRNQDILPEFNLIPFVAVQSLGGESEVFESWFEALEWMENEIDKIDYDIALIGCGAYGFPLAAHIKRSGKKAVHLGGALQLMFGIKGKRWEDPMYGVKEWGIPKGYYSSMMNEYWVRAGENLRPKNANEVEGACYW